MSELLTGQITPIKYRPKIDRTIKGITYKQRKWLKHYLEHGNATEAAFKVYNCKNRESASVIGYENIRKLNYSDFMEEAGVTEVLLQKKMIEGLDAVKTVAAMRTRDNAQASDSDFIDVPDYIARHKYLETALKLKKRLDNNNTQIVIDKMLILDGTSKPNPDGDTDV
jgi:mannitol-specific phosphotransferase system IIBC component